MQEKMEHPKEQNSMIMVNLGQQKLKPLGTTNTRNVIKKQPFTSSQAQTRAEK